MISCMKNPKDYPTKKPLKFSKVWRYRIITQKLVAIIYTSIKIPERKIKKKIPFTIAYRRKYLEINLSEKINHLYNEMYKAPMKGIEGNTNTKIFSFNRFEEYC